MKIITSTQNPLIKELKKLQSTHARKKTTPTFIVEGKRAVATCITSSKLSLVHILCTPELVAWVDEQKIPDEIIVQTTKEIIQDLSSATTPSGIVGIFQPTQEPCTKLGSSLVLAEIQDPGNMGTLIRTATALGVECIIIGGTSPYHPKVIQSTAGVLAHASIRQMSWKEFIQHTTQEKITTIALAPDQGIPISQAHTDQHFALIVGNEARGLPKEWLDECAIQAHIPMKNSIESLNAATAGAIALYELIR